MSVHTSDRAKKLRQIQFFLVVIAHLMPLYFEEFVAAHNAVIVKIEYGVHDLKNVRREWLAQNYLSSMLQRKLTDIGPR